MIPALLLDFAEGESVHGIYFAASGCGGRKTCVGLADQRTFYVAAQLAPERMNSTLYVFSMIFDLVFAVQGVSALCYVLHKRGKGKWWKLAAFIAGCFAARTVAMMIGIADQAVDFTHRRAELDGGENPYDPFGSKPQA